MFCRRMSRMNASLGRVSAMYVKLCSGPTPMYAPPGEARPGEGLGDLEVRGLVGDGVVGEEGPVGLGERGDLLAKGRGRGRRGGGDGGGERRGRSEERRGDRSEGRVRGARAGGDRDRGGRIDGRGRLPAGAEGEEQRGEKQSSVLHRVGEDNAAGREAHSFSAEAGARSIVLGSRRALFLHDLPLDRASRLRGAGPARGSASAFVWPNVPEQVEKALTSGDVSERRLAAARLADLPPEIALRLIPPALGDPDVEVRLRIAQAAIARRMPRAGDAVMAWLSESDARIRLSACDVIRAAPTDRSVVALGRVLGDPEPHVRLAAAAAMGSSGLPEAVAPLLGHLDDGSPEVREEVARALGRIGDTRAVVPLIGRCKTRSPTCAR